MEEGSDHGSSLAEAELAQKLGQPEECLRGASHVPPSRHGDID